LDAILEMPSGDIQIKSRTLTLKNKFSDTNSPLPIQWYQIEPLLQCVKWAFTATSKIVVYDTKGIYSTLERGGFKVMGHERFEFDGGLPAWIKEKAIPLKKTGTIV
jgi:hypothetical protein